MRFQTRAVHAGGKPDPATGAIAPPIHLSTTFEHGPAAETPRGYMYIRESNPTQTRLEQALAEIEGGEAALVFGSGLAAGAASLQALPAGSHVIFPDDIYYGFRTIAQEFLPRWGMESTALDMADLASVRAAVQSEHAADLGGDSVESAHEDRGPRRARVDRARGRRAADRRRNLRDAGAPAPARARRRRGAARDDEVSRRTQRRAGRRDDPPRARRRRPRRSSTSATSWAPSPRRSTPGSCCAGCARSRAGWSGTAPTASPSRERSRRTRASRPCTIPASSPIRATRWRRVR